MTYWEEFAINYDGEQTYCNVELLEEYHHYLLERGFVAAGPDNAFKEGEPCE